MNNSLQTENILQEVTPFIREMLLECGSMAKDFRKNGIDFELKADGTKVTKADLAVQKFVLDKLTSKYPNFRITAEEILDGKYSSINHENMDSDFRWIIDPIDGTSMFVQPNETFFGHAIALLYKNKVIFSAFYAPEHEIEKFKTNKWSGILFEASELSKGILVNEKSSFINNNETSFKERRIILDKVNSEKLNIKDFKAEFKSRSATLSLSLLASGHENSVVVFSNGNAAIWDVAPGNYLVEKAGGICVDKDFKNIFPLEEGREALKLKGQITRPVISGEYFAGYPNAVKELLEFKTM
jgi:3'-phosphoadenosine 5'-phosphosulfate (PAPS) 3'-phosphatase